MGNSSIIYGTAPTTATTKELLKEANKTSDGLKYWKNLQYEAEKQLEAGIDIANTEYMAGVKGAFLQGQQNKGAIAGSNIIDTQKNQMMDYYNKAIEEAYKSYRNEYATALGTAYDAYAKNYAAIDEALTAQSKFTTDFSNLAYDYATYLNEDVNNPFVNEEGNVLEEYSYLFARDEEGNLTNELLTRDQLNQLLYDQETNELNRQGQQFYDMIFSSDPSKVGTSYASYLAENNPELAEWALSTNQYDASGLTNYDYVRQMMGLDSKSMYDVGKYKDLYGENFANVLGDMDEDARSAYIANNENLSDEERQKYASMYKVDLETGKIKELTDKQKSEYEVTNADGIGAGMDNETIYKRFRNANTDAFSGYGDGGDQDKYANKVIDAGRDGLIPNGTVIDVNYGTGSDANFLYMDGVWYEVDEDYDESWVLDEDGIDNFIVMQQNSRDAVNTIKSLGHYDDILGMASGTNSKLGQTDIDGETYTIYRSNNAYSQTGGDLVFAYNPKTGDIMVDAKSLGEPGQGYRFIPFSDFDLV